MSTSARRIVFDQVLVDLNTQCDYLLPGGALPVSNRGEVLPNVRALMNWARSRRIPVISSLEAHRPGEQNKGLPPHCIDHSRGQRKLPFTLMPRRAMLQGDNTLDVPLDPFRRYQQIIFTKRDDDFLANPKADRLINAVSPGYWVIFGITVTHCVKAVALGLLARQHQVIVVRDACGYWCESDGEHAFRQMEAKGAILATTEETTSGAVEAQLRVTQVNDEVEDDPATLVPLNGESRTEKRLHTPTASSNGHSNGNGHSRNGKSRTHKTTKPDIPDAPSRTDEPAPVRQRSSKSRRDLA